MADHAAAAAAIIIQRNCHSNTDELTEEEEAGRARERPLRSVVWTKAALRLKVRRNLSIIP